MLFLQVPLLNKLFCPVTKSDSQLLSPVLAGVEMWIPGVGTAFYLEAFGFRSRGRFSRRWVMLKGAGEAKGNDPERQLLCSVRPWGRHLQRARHTLGVRAVI